MRVRDLYTPGVIVAAPDESLRTAVVRMRDYAVGSVMILRRDELCGILTESDVVAAVAAGRDPVTTPVVSCMTAHPTSVHPDANTADAALEMINLGIRHLPVVEDDKLLGMISARDLLTTEAESSAARSDP